jgi:hypothetical protein
MVSAPPKLSAAPNAGRQPVPVVHGVLPQVWQFKLKVMGQFNSDASGLKVFHYRPSCQEREKLPAC